MKSMKELTSIKIVPFTLMSSALNAVWAFVFALVFLVIGGSLGALLAGTQFEPLSGIIVGISIAVWLFFLWEHFFLA